VNNRDPPPASPRRRVRRRSCSAARKSVRDQAGVGATQSEGGRDATGRHQEVRGNRRRSVGMEPERCPGSRPWALSRLPNGGGGRAARAVRLHLRPNREAAAARPGPMLTLTGARGEGRRGSRCARNGSPVRQAGRPSRRGQACPSRAANPCLPSPAGQRTLAFEAARAVSRLGDGPRPSGKMSGGAVNPRSRWDVPGSLPARGR
jgi:hypothetical protein